MRKKKIVIEEIKEEPIIEEPVVEEITTPEFYVVRHGDTLESIATSFKTTADKIKELNGISDIIGGNQIRIK